MSDRPGTSASDEVKLVPNVSHYLRTDFILDFLHITYKICAITKFVTVQFQIVHNILFVGMLMIELRTIFQMRSPNR
jgi:hypothetical protein